MGDGHPGALVNDSRHRQRLALAQGPDRLLDAGRVHVVHHAPVAERAQAVLCVADVLTAISLPHVRAARRPGARARGAVVFAPGPGVTGVITPTPVVTAATGGSRAGVPRTSGAGVRRRALQRLPRDRTDHAVLDQTSRELEDLDGLGRPGAEVAVGGEYGSGDCSHPLRSGNTLPYASVTHGR